MSDNENETIPLFDNQIAYEEIQKYKETSLKEADKKRNFENTIKEYR
jgi:hypothetical protein